MVPAFIKAIITLRTSRSKVLRTFKESELMERLKSLDYRVVILVLLALSTPFVSPSVALPVTIISFTSLIAMKKWLDHNNKPKVNIDIENDVKAIKNQMSNIMIKNAAKPEEMAKEFKRFF